MKAWVACIVLAACGSKDAGSGAVASAPAAPVVVAPIAGTRAAAPAAGSDERAPTVTSAALVGIPPGPPPLLVYADEPGVFTVAAPPATWAEIRGRGEAGAVKRVEARELDRRMRMAARARWSPGELFAQLGAEVDLTALAAVDSDPSSDRPAAAGSVAGGVFSLELDGSLDRFAGESDALARAVAVALEAAPERRLVRSARALVLAAPRAPARALISGLVTTRGWIGIVHAATVAPLHLELPEVGAAPERVAGWIEVRAEGPQVAIELVPGTPTRVPAADLDAIAAAISAVRARAQLAPSTPVDVLVEEADTAQRAVDLIGAVVRGGATTVGLGLAPAAGTAALGVRGRPLTGFQILRVNAPGPIDRRALDRQVRDLAALRACHEAAVAADAGLSGEVLLAFDLDPAGRASNVAVDGGPAALTRCFADALGATTLVAPTRAMTRVTVQIAIDARPVVAP